MSTPPAPPRRPPSAHHSTLRDCAVAGEPASTMAKAAITVRTILRVVRALLWLPESTLGKFIARSADPS